VLFNTVLFTGNANPTLAQDIATHLSINLGKAKVGRFSDGEVDVEIEQNVRARDIFVVQSTCSPTNENLMELCIMVDALKRASARRVTAVIPYFGYARQDRRPRSTRVPISAKVVANLLEAVGVELVREEHLDVTESGRGCGGEAVVGAELLPEHAQVGGEDRHVRRPTRCGPRTARALTCPPPSSLAPWRRGSIVPRRSRAGAGRRRRPLLCG